MTSQKHQKCIIIPTSDGFHKSYPNCIKLMKNKLYKEVEDPFKKITLKDL